MNEHIASSPQHPPPFNNVIVFVNVVSLLTNTPLQLLFDENQFFMFSNASLDVEKLLNIMHDWRIYHLKHFLYLHSLLFLVCTSNNFQ